MDTLEIVIAEIDLPLGPAPRAELLVNGIALTQLVEELELGRSGYAPLPAGTLLRTLRAVHVGGSEPVRVAALGCCCGDDRCSWVDVEVRNGPERVRWERLMSSATDVLALGPFAFDRAQYEEALRRPRVAAGPVRPYES